MDRVEWPVDVPVGPQAPVGVVVVSFNTMDLTAQTIYSLFRHVRAPRFHLVVVDNASTDGSVQMLQALAEAGLCEVILNPDQRYHGPGLNQAINHLARRQRTVAAHERVGYLWVLDSDCMVTRDDALSASADLMRFTGAGIVGQRTHDQWHHGDMMGLHCLLLDPQQVWRAPVTPFQEHGSPSEALQQSAARVGIQTADFPFTSAGYAVHLGRGTLRAIAAAADRDNRYFSWASDHREPHFMQEEDAPARYGDLLRHFTAEVADLTPASMVAACVRYASMSAPWGNGVEAPVAEIDWGIEIVSLLAPWRLRDARVTAELTDLGDRARVWRVETVDGPVVAKLTFDRPGVVEPGLRIAELVEAAGIPTGAPIRTADGTVCVAVDRAPERPWTLALHRFVPGNPLDRSAADAAELAGGLLGRIHRILAQSPQTPAPAGRLLEYYAGEAAGGTGPRSTALAEALSAVAVAADQVRLDEGVLYGDPAPEILVDPGTSRLALIDWGTPSFGPLMHDIVSWQLFLSDRRDPAEREIIEKRFTDAYLEQNPINDQQLEARDAFVRFHRAIDSSWSPAPM